MKVSSAVPAVEIKPDQEWFVPVKENGLTWLLASVPANFQGVRATQLPHRHSCLVDCGFTAKVPEGYILVLELSPEYKDRGLEIYNNTIIGESKVSLGVRNVGREVVSVRDRDRIATARIQPLYDLTFEVKDEF